MYNTGGTLRLEEGKENMRGGTEKENMRDTEKEKKQRSSTGQGMMTCADKRAECNGVTAGFCGMTARRGVRITAALLMWRHPAGQR